MRTGTRLEQVVRIEIKYYKKKQELIHRHRMAHYKLETQRQFLYAKLHQWEILEKDKLYSEMKKNIIFSYIKQK